MQRFRSARLFSMVGVMSIAVIAGACTSQAGSAKPASSSNTGKSPIVIFQTNSFSGAVANQPQTGTGAQAAVKEINSTGGINGHPLQLVQCDNQGSPDMTNTCAQKAKTVGAAAIVGSAVFFPAAWDILQSQGIPYLLGEGLSPQEDSDSVSFPLAGEPGWYYGEASYLKSLGVKHPAIIRCEISACAYTQQLFYAGLARVGITPVRAVVAPLATTDYSSFAAAAMQGNVDAVVVSGTEQTAVPEAKALRQQGFTGKIISVSADISADAIQSLGSAGEGIYVIGQTQQPTTGTKQVQQFIKDMNAVDPSAKKDELALVAWAGVKLFAQVADRLKTVDASSVLNALQTAPVGSYDIGLTAPLPTSKTSPLSQYPRLAFDTNVTYNQAKNGTIVQTSNGFQDPFASK